MKNRQFALVLPVVVQVVAGGASAARAQEVAPKTYQIEFTFDGLVTFVPVDRAADGKTSRELWVIAPAADRIRAISEQAGSRRHDDRFRPKDGKYVAHHTLLCAPAAAVTNPGGGEGRVLTVLDGGLRQVELSGLPDSFRCDALADPKKCVTLERLDDLPVLHDGAATARACRGCLGTGVPPPLAHGTHVPLGLRMVFNHRETVAVQFHSRTWWHYSKDDPGSRRRLPAAVSVTTPDLTGPTRLTIRNPAVAGQELHFDIAPPANGKTVVFRIRVAPAAEALDGEPPMAMSSTAHETPLEHFRLGYLLAPKDTNGQPFDYDYEDYVHPVLLPSAFELGTPVPFCRGLGTDIEFENGDPFCTSPSQSGPPPSP